MNKITRRQFNFVVGAAAGVLAAPSIVRAARPRVVVIGGGAGGATAARYIARDSEGAIDVILVEASKHYYTCFFSNLYLGGFRDYASIGHSYGKLATEYGINVVHDWAMGIDTAAKRVSLASGASLGYDKLVLSPGIDIKYESVEGYSVDTQDTMPHAWESGTQVQLLKARVENMREGGTFIMVPPPNPYRCPPGPYERVSMIAHIFKQRNPTAKIIVLDPKPKFSKQALFQEGWEKHYSGMIEWIPSDVHGGIVRVDPEKLEVVTDFDTFRADAATVIPAQKAGAIADAAGVTDGDWVPIVPASMASRANPDIYVLGDASIASAMPKSGFAANSQAKVAANAIRGELTDSKVFEPRYANTCWSLIAENDGVKIGASYKPGETELEEMDSFISQTGEDAALRKATYEESQSWYSSIVTDIFG